MRSFRDTLGFLAATLLLLSGCATEGKVKPPKQPECYIKPPDEARFAQPPEYPAKSLNQDVVRPSNDPGDGSPLRRNAGMGAGRGS